MLKVSLYYAAGAVVQIVLALYFATRCSASDTRFLRNVFKAVIFFPYLINGVAIGMIFLFFFQPGGTLDAALERRRPGRGASRSVAGRPGRRQLLPRRDVRSGGTSG